MKGISVSDADKEKGSPKAGDMIGVNPSNENDRWLVEESVFNETYELVPTEEDNKNSDMNENNTTPVDAESFEDRLKKAITANHDSEDYEISYVTINDNSTPDENNSSSENSNDETTPPASDDVSNENTEVTPDDVKADDIEVVLAGAKSAITDEPLNLIVIPSDTYLAILSALAPVYTSFKRGVMFTDGEFSWSNDAGMTLRDNLVDQIGNVVSSYLPNDQKAIFVEYVDGMDYYLFILNEEGSVYDMVFNAKYQDADVILTTIPYDKVNNIKEKINK